MACTHHLTMLETFQARFEHLFYGKQNAHQQLHIPALLLSGVGALYLLSFAYKLVHVLVDLHVLPGTPLTKYGGGRSSSTSRPKAWAVVTGATDGIGREFALQLARAGFSIVLASRSADKLSSVAAEVKAANASAETRTAVIDFSKADAAQYAALEATLASLNIGVLVNNVGKSHDMPVPFAETTLEEMMSISEINVNATLRVTRMVVPGMVQQGGPFGPG